MLQSGTAKGCTHNGKNRVAFTQILHGNGELTETDFTMGDMRK